MTSSSMSGRYLSLAIACLALVSTGVALNWHALIGGGAQTPRIEFNRDIRPILNQNCTSCHGGVKQAGQVSFIYREQVLGKGKSGRPTVVPGRPGASELIARITSRDPQVRMPLHAPPLSGKQIDLLRQWIGQGAQWEDYWAFVAPKPQALPPVKQANWVRQPLDRFILARLEQEGLHPSPEADKAALLRRASFDLTGFPPTLEELSAFLADPSADAYEKQVDRLLASPHYGERWASMWMDLARYADSMGDVGDANHAVWPYRDWVVASFNRNLSYNQFVIQQLAGDLLPGATLEDYIASVFYRLNQHDTRLNSVMERMATTWSVLNGITMNCVQCHAHPFDPIRHTDYYTSLAFFNTSQDYGAFDEWPFVKIPVNPTQSAQAFGLQRKIASVSRSIVDKGRSLAQADAWTKLPVLTASDSEILGLQRYLADLESDEPYKGDDSSLSPKDRKKNREKLAKTIRRDLANAGKKTPAVTALGVREGSLEIADHAVPLRGSIDLVVSSAASSITALRLEILPKDAQKAQTEPENPVAIDHIDAWVKRAGGQEEKIRFGYFVPDSEMIFEDQVSLARLSVSGALSRMKVHDAFARADNFASRLGLEHPRWIIAVAESPVHMDSGSELRIRLTHFQQNGMDGPAIPNLLRLSVSSNSAWTAFARDPSLMESLAQVLDMDRHLAAIPSRNFPVMSEQPSYERHETREFEAGDYQNPIGPALAPDVPATFPKLPPGIARNRLALAQWFFSPSQPLTARVAVDRYWEQLFGLGLVETLENFGSIGAQPSHPQLLDWLALHFQQDLRWDMKALLRELTTSATYRQSAQTTPLLRQMDPRNRLLSHGPRQRLSAEMIRDQALLASGLLSPKIGGPPVMPPQPPGIWESVSVNTSEKWVDARGPDRYRRALYTFSKRKSPYPSFTTFDSVSHEKSAARRVPTNTPLQALVTLNDPVYYEAAQALAKHWLEDVNGAAAQTHGDLLDARLDDGARRVISRDLTRQERAVLRQLYDAALDLPEPTRDLLAVTTRSATVSRVTPHDKVAVMTALTAVASALLNLDAALTR